ncbi:hypothetical protein T484DRAFT_1788153 [Baffinella frigidus]|nr:hypothetical protein T484DRAFT_1788153 [Cryptophyta sp. CCMP2293]
MRLKATLILTLAFMVSEAGRPPAQPGASAVGTDARWECRFKELMRYRMSSGSSADAPKDVAPVSRGDSVRIASPYHLFVRASVQRMKEEESGKKGKGGLLKEIAERWRGMSLEQRARWRPDGEEGSKAGRAVMQVRGGVKWQPGAWHMFLAHRSAERREAEAQGGGAANRSQGESHNLLKDVAQEWRSLTSEERAAFAPPRPETRNNATARAPPPSAAVNAVPPRETCPPSDSDKGWVVVAQQGGWGDGGAQPGGGAVLSARSREEVKEALAAAKAHDRYRRLTALGFVFQRQGEEWESRFQELLAFRTKFGHPSPKFREPSSIGLGHWYKP